MRERNKKLGTHQLSVRVWTLKDKDSMFRAKRPDKHIVELITHTGRAQVMLRDWWFDTEAEAAAQYDQLATLLK